MYKLYKYKEKLNEKVLEPCNAIIQTLVATVDDQNQTQEKETRKKVDIVAMQQEECKNIGNEKFDHDQMSKLTREESGQEGKIRNLAIVSYFDAASNRKGGWIVLLIILYFVIQVAWISIDLILSSWILTMINSKIVIFFQILMHLIIVIHIIL